MTNDKSNPNPPAGGQSSKDFWILTRSTLLRVNPELVEGLSFELTLNLWILTFGFYYGS